MPRPIEQSSTSELESRGVAAGTARAPDTPVRYLSGGEASLLVIDQEMRQHPELVLLDHLLAEGPLGAESAWSITVDTARRERGRVHRTTRGAGNALEVSDKEETTRWT